MAINLSGCIMSFCIFLLTKDKERVIGLHKNQNAPEQVFTEDAVFYVVCVMFHAEGQQFQDQAQQLHCLVVILGWNVVHCVG